MRVYDNMAFALKLRTTTKPGRGWPSGDAARATDDRVVAETDVHAHAARPRPANPLADVPGTDDCAALIPSRSGRW